MRTTVTCGQDVPPQYDDVADDEDGDSGEEVRWSDVAEGVTGLVVAVKQH